MLRVAILGAGRIGRIHARNVALSPKCHLVGVADPIGTAAQDLAALYGCDHAPDPSSFINRDDVDAVVIGTPTDTHIEYTLQAVGSSKAVLCEKPIDLSLERAKAADAQITAQGGKVMVAFNRRFDPAVRALRQAIEADEVGGIRQVIISSRDPSPPPVSYIRTSGGIFKDMVIHDFDMARFLLGEEPVEVQAIASCLVDPQIAQAGDADTVMVQLRTASGKQCQINCCRAASYGYDQRLEVLGSKGMLQNGHVRSSTIRRFTADATDSREPLLNFFLDRYAEAYELELEAFATALLDGAPLPVTTHDGVQALRLAEAADVAARENRTVQL